MFNSPWTVIFIMTLFFVNCERTVLFSVKRDLDPPFTTVNPVSAWAEITPCNRAFSYDGSHFASPLEISVEEKIQRGYPWEMGQVTVMYRATAVHKFPLNSLRNQWIAFLCANNHSIYVLMTVAAAALWELTWLILINQLKLTGLQKNRDAAANFGCSWNFNRVNGYHGD